MFLFNQLITKTKISETLQKNVLRTFLNCELSLKPPGVKSSAYINTYSWILYSNPMIFTIIVYLYFYNSDFPLTNNNSVIYQYFISEHLVRWRLASYYAGFVIIFIAVISLRVRSLVLINGAVGGLFSGNIDDSLASTSYSLLSQIVNETLHWFCMHRYILPVPSTHTRRVWVVERCGRYVHLKT